MAPRLFSRCSDGILGVRRHHVNNAAGMPVAALRASHAVHVGSSKAQLSRARGPGHGLVNIGLRVRAQRQCLGWSLRTVSEKSGLSISFLSQVERDLVAPSISSLKQIAEALGVSIAELLGGAERGPQLVVRRADRPVWSLARVRFELLATGRGRTMEPQLLTYEPGADSGEHPISHEGEEFVFVLEGSLTCQLGDDAALLGDGDCAYFSARIPHRMRNESAAPSRCLLVVTPPSF